MTHGKRRLGLVSLVGFLTILSPVLAAPKWVAIGEFQAGGENKAVAYNGPVEFCRIVCTEGSVIINTFTAMEGQKRTPIPLAVRIPAGQAKEFPLPGGVRNVTEFRISDNARGKYRLEVLKRGGGDASAPVAAPAPVPANKTASTKEERKAERKKEKAEQTAKNETVKTRVPIPIPIPIPVPVPGTSGGGKQTVPSTPAPVNTPPPVPASGDPQIARGGAEDAEAACARGYQLAMGLGVPKDPVMARKLYERAAAGGVARANRLLAELYWTGEGGPQDRESALLLMRTAVKQGDQEAKARLAQLEAEAKTPPPPKTANAEPVVVPKPPVTTAEIPAPVLPRGVDAVAPGTPLWKVTLNGAFKPKDKVAIGPDGTVYATARYLTAVTPAGKLKWEFTAVNEEWAVRYDWPNPLVGPDGTVFVLCGERRLYAVKPDGTRRWDQPMDARYYALLDADTLVAGLQEQQTMLALRTDTGETVRKYDWTSEDDDTLRGCDSWLVVAPWGEINTHTYGYKRLVAFKKDGARANPLAWTMGSEAPAFGPDGRAIYNDRQVWVYAGGKYLTNYVGSTPGDSFTGSPLAGPDGTVYAAGRVTETADETSRVIGGLLVALDPDCRLKWELRMAREATTSPVRGADGMIYVGDEGGVVHAVDAEGREQWTFQAPGPVCPLTLAGDGTLYFGSVGGSELFAIRGGSLGKAGPAPRPEMKAKPVTEEEALPWDAPKAPQQPAEPAAKENDMPAMPD
jgi:outer membrane protein assembly factor BamB